MPLGPFDEYLAHQTSDTFDHVATSDRNFYDRYYFNMHSSSDELFVITGLGQYPNLGVTDAFITVSIGTEQHTVRASRELGSDRMDTSVGPLSVEVLEGLRKLRVRCDAERVGHRGRPHVHRHGRRARRSPARSSAATGACIQDVTRYAQVGVWEGTLTAAGRTFDVTPDRWKGARDRSWGVRPVGEPEHPGHQGRARRAGRLRLPPRLAADAVRRPHAEDPDRPGRRRPPPRRGVDAGLEPRPRPARSRSSAARRSMIEYIPGTREMRGATVTHAPTPTGKPITVRNTPLRTLYLAAGSGYVQRRRRGATASTRVRSKVEGHRARPLRPRGAAQVRASSTRRCAGSSSTTGEVGYGMHENMLMGVYRPTGFETPETVRARLTVIPWPSRGVEALEGHESARPSTASLPRAVIVHRARNVSSPVGTHTPHSASSSSSGSGREVPQLQRLGDRAAADRPRAGGDDLVGEHGADPAGRSRAAPRSRRVNDAVPAISPSRKRSLRVGSHRAARAEDRVERHRPLGDRVVDRLDDEAGVRVVVGRGEQAMGQQLERTGGFVERRPVDAGDRNRVSQGAHRRGQVLDPLAPHHRHRDPLAPSGSPWRETLEDLRASAAWSRRGPIAAPVR